MMVMREPEYYAVAVRNPPGVSLLCLVIRPQSSIHTNLILRPPRAQDTPYRSHKGTNDALFEE